MSSANYRPWLDGVRGVAILLVLSEHVGLSRRVAISTGGIGVGIFFALSGYLITGLLIGEIDRTGDVALRRFYLRRLARLTPALLAMVVLCDVFFLCFDARRELLSSMVALTYLTNYVTIWRDHYLPAFGHTWSLAVEEHFYLLWPVLVLALSRRFTLRGTLNITLAMCIAVLLWRAFVATRFSDSHFLLYVGSIERADAILYGCAGCTALKLGWRPPKACFYLGAALVTAQTLKLFPSAAASSTLLGIGSTSMLVALDTHELTERRLLSLKPLVWTGIMSYGIYLWHLPLFSIAAKLHFTSLSTKLTLAGTSFAIAYLSHRYLESPIRDYVRSREVAGPVASTSSELPLALSSARTD